MKDDQLQRRNITKSMYNEIEMGGFLGGYFNLRSRLLINWLINNLIHLPFFAPSARFSIILWISFLSSSSESSGCG